ncbi:MAG: histidine phosphatase family protein [Candidatus Woesearchaeota archaeon]
MSVKITYFVHGTTTDNEEHKATGWNPGELSELGIKQSKELPSLIKAKFDVIFTSDLKRAIDSAELSFGKEIEIIQDERLRECNYGDWNGAKKDWNIIDFIDTPYPNGESYKDVEKRIQSFLNDLIKNYDGKHITIVAHQGPQLAIEVVLNKKTWKTAIETDWRKSGKWKPGWEYEVK